MKRKHISSIRRPADKAGLDHVSVTRVVPVCHGDRAASKATTHAIAGALDIDMKAAYRLMSSPVKYVEQWTPPACAARMDPEQRRAVEGVILVMVEGHRPGMGIQAEGEADHPERKARGAQDTVNGAYEAGTEREG